MIDKKEETLQESLERMWAGTSHIILDPEKNTGLLRNGINKDQFEALKNLRKEMEPAGWEIALMNLVWTEPYRNKLDTLIGSLKLSASPDGQVKYILPEAKKKTAIDVLEETPIYNIRHQKLGYDQSEDIPGAHDTNGNIYASKTTYDAPGTDRDGSRWLTPKSQENQRVFQLAKAEELLREAQAKGAELTGPKPIEQIQAKARSIIDIAGMPDADKDKIIERVLKLEDKRKAIEALKRKTDNTQTGQTSTEPEVDGNRHSREALPAELANAMNNSIKKKGTTVG